jgi:hypothetical protein
VRRFGWSLRSTFGCLGFGELLAQPLDLGGRFSSRCSTGADSPRALADTPSAVEVEQPDSVVYVNINAGKQANGFVREFGVLSREE